MPELPEVETVRRGLERALPGATLLHAHVLGNLREPIDERELDEFCRNRTIVAVRRRAKYLLVIFSEGDGLLLHLGMTGSFTVGNADEPNGKHQRIRWELADGRAWNFHDIRRFGLVRICHDPCQTCDPPCLAKLGMEPLDDGFTAAFLMRQVNGHACAIKEFLMDQSQIAGIGNIYASESLFRAHIHPERPASSLSLRGARKLVEGIRTVLTESIAAGGTTISDFRTLDGSEGAFTVQLQVYGRDAQPCVRCGTAIERIVQGGRSTFFCPKCQKCRK